PTKTPKTIDLTLLGPVRKTMLGIYTLEGDTLKVCMVIDPDRVNQRPTAFVTKAGVMQVIVTAKRQPPEKVGEIRQWEAHTEREGVWGVALSPDGRRVLSCGDDGSVALWNLTTGEEIWRSQIKPLGLRWAFFRLRAVAFSPDGRSALVACYDNTVRLLDATTGKEIRRFEGHRA